VDRYLLEFNMLTFTKQDSIVIAVTLGIVLAVPLLIPAFSTSVVPNRAASSLSNRDHAGAVAKRVGVDVPSRRPVVDFGLYYGPRIHFRQSGGGSIEC
jgi:hypothetical protein